MRRWTIILAMLILLPLPAQAAKIVLGGAANWSTCNGGGAPGDTDDIRLNGFALTLDSAGTLTCADVVAQDTNGTKTGGSIVIPAGATRTLNANVTAGSATLIAISGTINFTLGGNVSLMDSAVNAVTISAGTLHITGTVTAGSVGPANGINCTGGTLTVNGLSTGGSASNSNGINIASGSPTVTTGALKGGSTSGNCAGLNITNSATPTLTINGNIDAGTNTGAYGLLVGTGTNINCTITGNVTASAVGVWAVSLSSGTWHITGTVTGGTATSAYGINIAGGVVTLTVDGAVTAGNATTAHGIYCNVAGAHSITCNSTVQGSPGNFTGCGVSLGSSSTNAHVYVYGNITGGGNASAYGVQLSASSNIITVGTVSTPVTITSGTGAGLYVGGCAASTIYANIVATGSSSGLRTNGGSNLTIYGNCTSTSTSSGNAVYVVGGTVVLNGNVDASNNMQNGVLNFTSGTVTVNGDITNGTKVTAVTTTSGITSFTHNPSSGHTFVWGGKTWIQQTDITAVGNVRSGTAVYQGGSNGTLSVPARGDVRLGISVDNTTGTFAPYPAIEAGK